MDIIITIPKTINWRDYEKEIDAARNGDVELNFKIPHCPKDVNVGDRCYVCYDGFLRGWMKISFVGRKNGFNCTTTGRDWDDGYYISRTGKFHPLITSIPMQGFRGYKKMSSLPAELQKRIYNADNDSLTLTENKVIRLVEERGVAASPYGPAIDTILDYCRDKAKGLQDGDRITFVIPENLTSPIDFIDKLNISVEILDNEAGATSSGGGDCTVRYSPEIENGKIKHASITIYAYSHFGVLYDRTLTISLYHELNHVYDYYRDVIKTGNAERYAKTTRKGIINKNAPLFGDKETDEQFKRIIYRLFSETELNAMVASVYGDLKGMSSERTNFQKDIRETQAYFVYEEIKNSYRYVFSQINPSNLYLVLNYISNRGVSINTKTTGGAFTARNVRQELIRKTKYYLERLLKGMGRAASLYYDRTEFHTHPEKIVHVDDGIDMA